MEFTFHFKLDKKLYDKLEGISVGIRKRRLMFYGHIKR